jgi:hypothetical protein
MQYWFQGKGREGMRGKTSRYKKTGEANRVSRKEVHKPETKSYND